MRILLLALFFQLKFTQLTLFSLREKLSIIREENTNLKIIDMKKFFGIKNENFHEIPMIIM